MIIIHITHSNAPKVQWRPGLCPDANTKEGLFRKQNTTKYEDLISVLVNSLGSIDLRVGGLSRPPLERTIFSQYSYQSLGFPLISFFKKKALLTGRLCTTILIP